MSIESEEIIIQVITHPIRRQIFRILTQSPQTFTGLMDYFTISSAKLTYHLKNMTGFISNSEEGLYSLTPLGKKAIETLAFIQSQINHEDQPMIKQAYEGQNHQKTSMLLTGINLGIGIMVFSLFISTTIGIIAVTQSEVPIIIYPILGAIITLEIAGILWLWNVRRRTPETLTKWSEIFEKIKN